MYSTTVNATISLSKIVKLKSTGVHITHRSGWLDGHPVIIRVIAPPPPGPVQSNISRSACTAVVVVAMQLILRLSPTVVPVMGLGGDMVTTGGSGSV